MSNDHQFLFNIILLFLGSTGIITYIIKTYVDSKAKKSLTENTIKEKRAETINEIDKEKMLAEIRDDDQFKRLIIDKIIEKYVEQTSRIFQMFESEFKELVSGIHTLNKTIERSYAQTEILRSQSKEFHEVHSLKLSLIEGVLLGIGSALNKLPDIENFKSFSDIMIEKKETDKKFENVSSKINLSEL